MKVLNERHLLKPNTSERLQRGTDMANHESDLRQFIVENFLFGREDTPLGASDSLLALGIIDSTGVLELVVFLEQKYHITVEDEELVPENLDSIDRLLQFLRRKIEMVA
jgi:acyl carrier protein